MEPWGYKQYKSTILKNFLLHTLAMPDVVTYQAACLLKVASYWDIATLLLYPACLWTASLLSAKVNLSVRFKIIIFPKKIFNHEFALM